STLSSLQSLRRSLSSAAAFAALLLCARPSAAQPATAAASTNTCARCHAALAEPRLSAPPTAFAQRDIHRETGSTWLDVQGGAHGIRRVNDVKSPVFPTNVAATCAACHASASHMAGYTLPNKQPLPTNQLALYQQSVHYAALTKGNDLSAPTCNDCHGNHGAAPPGAGSAV